ncbi:hypothetical protein [Streptomyces sp. bgisy060]|uniref:hypothetical protein n=1 Tax=Streptomyces sp. bgisy060 TaxID=3413775 RepID=UPI003EBE8D8E
MYIQSLIKLVQEHPGVGILGALLLLVVGPPLLLPALQRIHAFWDPKITKVRLGIARKVAPKPSRVRGSGERKHSKV